MKTIRQTLILLTFALFFAANVTAAPLDERQRTVETVVADALAQLPAATAGDYDKIMGELAATGAEGVGILADMLVPASQGENAAVEYALNGVASFVTAAGREQLRPAVCEGLLAALARCKDDANRAFLVSQLQLCATADNAAALAAYIDDPYLGDPVLRALISIPDSEATLLSLARRSDLSDAQRAALAYAFGENAPQRPNRSCWAGSTAPTTRPVRPSTPRWLPAARPPRPRRSKRQPAPWITAVTKPLRPTPTCACSTAWSTKARHATQ